MPIYEYRCQQCGHQFDALQKMSDVPLVECPACKQPSLVKLVSAPSFRLSGSGWYETDFKTDKDKKKNLADSSNKQTGSDNKTGEDKKASGDSAGAPNKEKSSKTATSATTSNSTGSSASA